MDNVDTWVWILIAVVALLLLAGIVYALTAGRKAKEKRRLEQEREHREKAARLRDEGREATVTARQTEATAAAATADAEKARLEAERLERQAKELQHEAAEKHQHAEHHITEADKIDPDVRTDKHGNVTDDRGDAGETRVTRETTVEEHHGTRIKDNDADRIHTDRLDDNPDTPRR